MSITPTLSASLSRILQGPSGTRSALTITACVFATWFLVALWKHFIFAHNTKDEGEGKTDTGSKEQQSYEGLFPRVIIQTTLIVLLSTKSEWAPVSFCYPKFDAWPHELSDTKPIPYRPFRWGVYQ